MARYPDGDQTDYGILLHFNGHFPAAHNSLLRRVLFQNKFCSGRELFATGYYGPDVPPEMID